MKMRIRTGRASRLGQIRKMCDVLSVLLLLSALFLRLQSGG